MLPLLSLHAIATQRGEGLHPLLLAALKRVAAERVQHAVTECAGERPERATSSARSAQGPSLTAERDARS